ncbi:MAG: EFR1 family ferrodoxin [Prevotella sp.]|nr:EFR1 family ferrodoxin [Prevotella sp.]
MIFYFSGTGNTRWAAKLLAEKTGEQLVYIPDAMADKSARTIGKEERIGFAFPVHGWRPPKLVRAFVRGLRLQNEEGKPLAETGQRPYCYALCTAGDTIGQSIEYLEKDLKESGLYLDAAFSLLMPESYVGLPLMDVDPKEKELRKKASAARDLEGHIRCISEKVKTRKHLIKGPLPWLFSGLIGGFFVKYLVTDKPFRIKEERCIRCGRCATICPVRDIEGKPGKMPTWKHNGHCLTCFSCYHHCPKHAIEFGNRTKHKGQYFFED